MSAFVEECRREWRRLGVPDRLAEEMADDLTADLAEAQADGVPAAEILGESDPRRFAAAWASERGLVSEHPREGSRTRLWVVLGVCLVLLVAAGIAIPVVLVGSGESHSPTTFTTGGPVVFDHTPAVTAMKSVFAHPSAGPIPASIARFAGKLAKGAPAGTPDLPRGVLVQQGRLLLSNLGPKHHAIYVFPTRNKEVCVVISGPGPAGDTRGLGAGCKKAFIVGEPASVEGGSLHFPPTSGPPAELAGVTQDGVTAVSVVLNNKPQKAIFANDAWYYRFPDNHTPATAATELLITLSDGATATVPLNLSAPR